VEEQAREAIRTQGARVTATRVRVLATLLDAVSALTHQEVFDRIGRAVSVDRVTVYRVLEWLVQSGLAHRIAGEDRVWRFSALHQSDHDHPTHDGHDGEAHTHAQHGHFQCDACRRMFCIDAPVGIEQTLQRLPAGFEGRDVEMVVRGLCPACGKEAAAPPPRRRSKDALRKEL